ncbi:MAG: alkaline phosphatase family protein [Chloroflexi bacterium]|nr:alkaline phosphatase family protein [Chloroflexota bacterium]
MTLLRLWDRLSHWGHAVAAWFFRGRYLLLARVLGLRALGSAKSPPGTLFIEIDGLGYAHLLKAIERGYMPFVKQLLQSGDYDVYRWRCGLAADTPPIQSGLFYGTSEGIVGFYWWDRRTQKRITGSNPYDMSRIQAELAATVHQDGLLAGGSSYSNIMSGGAELSVLTIAGANPHWFRPGAGLLRALAVLALNPGKFVRFAFDATWEVLQEMEDRAFVNAMGRPRVFEGAFPLVRLLLNVLAREIVTAGARVDLLRGVPVIYACYIGYDVVAHHSGPLSRNSLRVLRGIDGATRRLFETCRWAERTYRVVLLSDHGMTPCQPVAEAFDHDFEEWVEQWWRQGVQASPAVHLRRRWLRHRRPRRPAQAQRGWLGRVAGSVARHSSGWLRTWGRIGAWTLELGTAGAIKLGERFLEVEDESATPRVAVISCGPLSQLWVRDVDRRLHLSEVEALAPGFARALVDHPAVELVIAREGDAIVVLGRSGKAILRWCAGGPTTNGEGRSGQPGNDREGSSVVRRWSRSRRARSAISRSRSRARTHSWSMRSPTWRRGRSRSSLAWKAVVT